MPLRPALKSLINAYCFNQRRVDERRVSAGTACGALHRRLPADRAPIPPLLPPPPKLPAAARASGREPARKRHDARRRVARLPGALRDGRERVRNRKRRAAARSRCSATRAPALYGDHVFRFTRKQGEGGVDEVSPGDTTILTPSGSVPCSPAARPLRLHCRSEGDNATVRGTMREFRRSTTKKSWGVSSTMRKCARSSVDARANGLHYERRSHPFERVRAHPVQNTSERPGPHRRHVHRACPRRRRRRSRPASPPPKPPAPPLVQADANLLETARCPTARGPPSWCAARWSRAGGNPGVARRHARGARRRRAPRALWRPRAPLQSGSERDEHS